MWYYFTSETNSIAIDNGYPLTEGQGFEATCQRDSWMDYDCLTYAYLKPKITKYIKDKSGCRDNSIWEIIGPEFSTSVKEACGDRGCTPNALPNKTLGYCKNWKDYDCSMAQLSKTLVKHAKTVPCEKLEYSGQYITQLLSSEASSNRLFIVMFSFKSPYTMTLNEEYYIVPTLDLIGIIGGTLGMFIGFSFYGTYSDIIDIIQFLASKINCKGK